MEARRGSVTTGQRNDRIDRSQGIGALVAAGVQQRFFDYLDHPVVLAASQDVPVPVSRELEEFCLISDEQIECAIASVVRG